MSACAAVSCPLWTAVPSATSAQSATNSLTLVNRCSLVIRTVSKELPAANWIYFEVTRSGDAWQDVLTTQTLAMRYKDALVDNKDSLEGQEVLVIHVPPKKVELQFGLFAVPTRP